MRKIFISSGHSNKKGADRGAVGNGYIEGELAVEFRDLLVKELKYLGVSPIVDSNDSILSKSIAFFKNKTSSDSIVLEIHWNASSAQATGVEVLVPSPPSEFEKNKAKEISSLIARVLNVRDRGVKTEADSHHGRLGWMRLTGENLLIEMCFITNKSDMESYQANKNKLAKEMASMLVEEGNTYTVVSGDTLSKIALRHKTTVTKIMEENNLKSPTILVGQKLKL
jgi:LysM repeat protein